MPRGTPSPPVPASRYVSLTPPDSDSCCLKTFKHFKRLPRGRGTAATGSVGGRREREREGDEGGKKKEEESVEKREKSGKKKRKVDDKINMT